MISKSRLFRLSCWLLLCVFTALIPVRAGEDAAEAWPALRSDLPVDPAIVSGKLGNGFRYAIKKNGVPKGRVSLRLIVAAGALHERDDERGLAHFVEHMAFRGSTNYPGEALANMLQREGFAFGPDNTAFTLHDHTIYHLELPGNSEATLRKALLVFNEYANHLVFDPELIERERGVILSEKAMRDTPDLRNGQKNIEALFPDSLLARRAVIGTEESIRTCTRETLVAFYNAWYRPDRLAITAVGDIDPEIVKNVITEIFSPMVARGPARPQPSGMKPAAASEPDARVIKDPGSIGSIVVFQHPFRLPVEMETREQRAAVTARNLAFAAFQRRLQRFSQKAGEGFVSPAAFVQDSAFGWQTAWFSASARADKWVKLLTLMEQEQRRVMLHGFTPDEIEPIRRQFLESLDAGVRTADTVDSRELVARLSASLLNGYPVTTSEAFRADLIDAVVSITPEDCHRAYREAWGGGPYHVHVLSNLAFTGTPDDARQLIALSQGTAVSAPTPSPIPEFAYQTFGKAGELVKQEYLSDLDVRLVQFANGVRLNFKQTDFDQDSVGICVRLSGGGRLSLKKKQAGLDWFASWAFVPGGLGRHAPTELHDILSGRSLSGWFNVTTDSFLLTARCSRRDLQLMFKLLAAHIVDPGYRPEAIPNAKASFGSYISEIYSSPGGPLRVSGEQILLDGDERFAMPVGEEYGLETLRELRKWLTPHFAKDPIEIAVVGDARWEDVLGIVSRTFGALPKRAEKPTNLKSPKFAKPPGRPLFFQSNPSLKQAAVSVVFPMPGCDDLASSRRAHLLAQALEERVRQTLREELGSAYVLDANFVEDAGLDNLNRMAIYAEVDLERLDAVMRRLHEELDKIRSDGFTDDEFLRVKAPFARAYRDEMRTNNYWLFTVLTQAQTDPIKIPAVRNRLSDIDSITKADIEKIYRTYVRRDQSFELVSLPPFKP